MGKAFTEDMTQLRDQEQIGFQRQGKYQLAFKIDSSRARNQSENRWQVEFLYCSA
jgi:hypothetical protein